MYVVEQSTGYTTILSECKVAADDNGTWSFISNSLPNATYTIWAEQKFIQTTSSDWERIGSAFSKLEIKLKDNPDKKACGGTLAFDETSPSRNGNGTCLDASGTWDIQRGWKLKKSHKQDIFFIPVDGGLIRYSGLLKNDKVEPKWGPTKVYMQTGLKYNVYTSLAFEMDLEKPPEAGFPPGSVSHTLTRIAVDR